MFSVTRILGSGLALVFLLTAVLRTAPHEFSVKLQGPNTAVKSDSDVHAKATITNTSGREIRFAVGFGNNEFDYEVEVADGHGQAPPLTPAFRHLKENKSVWWGSYATQVLKPGDFFDEDLVVTHLYKLGPGELRQQARKELLAETRKHRATKLLRQIPGIGPLRAAHLVAVMQTPHRFRTKRQLWTYSGLGLETHDSAQYRVVEQQLQRSKKSVTLRGLNDNHNHNLKDIFKGEAMRDSTAAGPLRDFYEALLAKGRKPTMARLTLARKIAASTLIVWKKEIRFDANYLKQQAA